VSLVKNLVSTQSRLKKGELHLENLAYCNLTVPSHEKTTVTHIWTYERR
jgi:hypothetical protein